MDNSGTKLDPNLSTSQATVNPPVNPTPDLTSGGVTFEPPKVTEPSSPTPVSPIAFNQTAATPTPPAEPWISPSSQTTTPSQPTTVVNVNSAPQSPWVATPVTTSQPVQTPTTPSWPTGNLAPSTTPVAEAQTTTVSETTTTVEPPLPTKKKGASPVLLGLVALVLVSGVAGMTFMVSRGVSNQAPIAPNAPSSEPQAFEPSPVPTEAFDQNGTADCSGQPNTAPYGNRCLPTVTDAAGNVTWAPDATVE
jgi:hypothetical protein